MNIEITRINQGIENSPSEYVRLVNTDYLYRLSGIVDEIEKNCHERPVILLAGPSGSGKTTTAMMIEKLLDERGHETHTISMDNYFCPLTEEEKRLSVLGKVDLESPARIDKELLNEQISAIEQCKEVEIPRYNFKTSDREWSGRTIKRNKGELVIFEGIHALNPDVITVPNENICKIYVSVRTRIVTEDIVLHPAMIRLMRRMIRDRNFRHRTPRETLNMFDSVEAGENKYIMPFKHRADYDVDTFLAYEMSVYKNDILDGLRQLEDAPELGDTIKVLEALDSIEKNDVTPDSLICEFIGNGQFKY
jgi:uridine kinase